MDINWWCWLLLYGGHGFYTPDGNFRGWGGGYTALWGPSKMMKADGSLTLVRGREFLRCDCPAGARSAPAGPMGRKAHRQCMVGYFTSLFSALYDVHLKHVIAGVWRRGEPWGGRGGGNGNLWSNAYHAWQSCAGRGEMKYKYKYYYKDHDRQSSSGRGEHEA